MVKTVVVVMTDDCGGDVCDDCDDKCDGSKDCDSYGDECLWWSSDNDCNCDGDNCDSDGSKDCDSYGNECLWWSSDSDCSCDGDNMMKMVVIMCDANDSDDVGGDNADDSEVVMVMTAVVIERLRWRL